MFAIRGAQLRFHNSKMHILQSSHRLEVNDDFVVNNQVKPVGSDFYSAEPNNNHFLLLDFQTPVSQFDHQSIFVNTLQETRTEFPMHKDRSTNDLLSQILEFQ